MTDLETRLLSALGLLLLASNTSLVDKHYLMLVLRAAEFDDEAIIMLHKFSRRRVLADEPETVAA